MKKNTEHTPINIEKLIIAVKNKEIGPKVLIQALLDAYFFIACSEEDLVNNKTILPICAEFEGQNSVCVFTRKEWAEKYMTTNISMVKLVASEWLKQHPARYGLIINPNYEACIKFSADGVQNILKEFL